MADDLAELQTQFTNYQETLQAIAGKIGDVEQETEEHKCVSSIWTSAPQLSSSSPCRRNSPPDMLPPESSSTSSRLSPAIASVSA